MRERWIKGWCRWCRSQVMPTDTVMLEGYKAAQNYQNSTILDSVNRCPYLW